MTHQDAFFRVAIICTLSGNLHNPTPLSTHQSGYSNNPYRPPAATYHTLAIHNTPLHMQQHPDGCHPCSSAQVLGRSTGRADVVPIDRHRCCEKEFWHRSILLGEMAHTMRLHQMPPVLVVRVHQLCTRLSRCETVGKELSDISCKLLGSDHLGVYICNDANS